MSNFAAQVRAFSQKAVDRVDVVVQDITTQVAASLIEKTPVDTGELRANWQFGLMVPAATIVGVFDQDGSNTLSGLKAEIKATKAGGFTYLVNNLPYMPVVEYGHYPNPPKRGTGKTINGFSTQAPAGVRDITVIEAPTYIKNVAAA